MIEKIKKIFTEHTFLIFAIFLISFFSIVLLINQNYYSYLIDDFQQYRPFMRKAIHNIKNGDFSSFNIFDNYGNSIYGLTYYLPIDIFSLLVFLLDYIIPFDYAFEIVEVLKIILGGLLFYKVLEKEGLNVKATLFGTLMFLISGGLTVFLVFPTYTSMFFYIPLVILFLQNAKKRKYLFIFLTAALFLYNFYNTYLIIINVFIARELILFYKTEYVNKEYFKCRLKELLKYALYTLIGLLISSIIVLPSLSYILNNSTIDRDKIWFSKEHFLIILTSLITPFRGTDFKNGNYIQTQASLYTGVFSLLFLCNFLKDKEQRKKKIIISSIILCFILFPIFSYILNGTGLYSRWFFLINLITIFFVTKEINSEKEINSNNYCLILIIIALLFISIAFFIPEQAVFFNVNTLIFTLINLLIFFLAILKRKNIKLFYNLFMSNLILSLCFIYNFQTFNTNREFISNSYNSLTNIEKILTQNDIKKDDRVFYFNNHENFINLNYFSDYNVDGRTSFQSFINKTNFEHFSNTTHFFIKNYWAIEPEKTSPMEAAFLNYKYFIVNKNNQDISLDVDFFELIFEDKNFKLYKNKYAFDGMIYYDTFSYTNNNYLDNQLVALNKLHLKDSPKEKAFYSETVYESKLKDHLAICKKDNDVFYKLNIKNLTYDDNYLYFVYIAGYQLIPFKGDNSTSIYGNQISWENEIEILFKTNFSNITDASKIKIEKIPKKIILEELNKQNKNNDIKVTFDKNVFKVIGHKEKGKEAYVTIPYTYSENFQSDYELINGNGGFLTVKLPKEIESFDININYIEKHNISISLSFIGLLISLGFMCYFEVNLHKKPKNDKDEPE